MLAVQASIRGCPSRRAQYTTRPGFSVNRTLVVALLVAAFILFPVAVNAPGWFRLDASVLGGPDVLR